MHTLFNFRGTSVFVVGVRTKTVPLTRIFLILAPVFVLLYPRPETIWTKNGSRHVLGSLYARMWGELGIADEKDAICSRILVISVGKPYFALYFAVRSWIGSK